tara:strand:+ start:204 stop:455 length:252 start_codon:yes stop_codon:yes gene_type:complete
MSPTFTVRVHDFHGEPKEVFLVTLTVWASALRSEAKGIQVSTQPAEPLVRKFLGTPEDYPLQAISDYITAAHRDIKSQLGLAA